MALNKSIWDPKLRGTKFKGTNLKSLTLTTTLRPNPKPLTSHLQAMDSVNNLNLLAVEAESGRTWQRPRFRV